MAAHALPRPRLTLKAGRKAGDRAELYSGTGGAQACEVAFPKHFSFTATRAEDKINAKSGVAREAVPLASARTRPYGLEDPS
jgi:hypothetical protein